MHVHVLLILIHTVICHLNDILVVELEVELQQESLVGQLIYTRDYFIFTALQTVMLFATISVPLYSIVT